MEETKFKCFTRHLKNGNFDGVKNNFELQFVDKTIDEDLNWKPIHYACWNGNIDIVQLLVAKKCNIESETKDKERPIHFACQSGKIEIVKLLIANNCIVAVKNENQWTPYDFARLGGHVDIAKFIQTVLTLKQKIREAIMKDNETNFARFYEPEILTGLNWLELALEGKAYKIIKYFLDRPLNVSELRYLKKVVENDPDSTNSQLWQEVLLYRCIRDHNEEGFKFLCSASVINRKCQIIPISFLEVASEHNCCVFVQEILRKSIFDREIWDRAKTVATYKFHGNIHQSIKDRESFLKYRQKANLSILHTAVCDNDPDMVEYILSKTPVDPNYSHEILGTALALAIVLCHEKCKETLERFNVDCNTQNKYLQSPLHDAICNGMTECCQYLIDRTKNIDQEGFMGMTALHYAVLHGCEDVCDQLVIKGADCMRYVEFLQSSTEEKGPLRISKRENCLTLCTKMNKRVYPCFLNQLDAEKANSSDDDGKSLLHLSAALLDIKLCNILIQAGGDVNSVTKQGGTPLYEMLSSLKKETLKWNPDKIIEIVNLFVKSGCRFKKRFKGDLSIFQIASDLNNERLLLALLSPQHDDLLDVEENLFHMAINKRFYRFSEVLLDLLPKDHLKSSITTSMIKTVLQHGDTNLSTSLVINASVDIQQSVLEIALYNLATLKASDSFQRLLDIEINDPQWLDEGETILTLLFREQKIDFCQKIIESKTNKKKYINFKNKKNETPLQVAIETESMGMVQQLIFETDHLDNEDIEGRTALMQLFLKMAAESDNNRYLGLLSAVKTIICEGGNIYHETSKGLKIIECCSPLETRNQIEMLFKNKQNKFSGAASMENNVERENERIFVVERSIESEGRICGVCLDREVNSVFECGHTICDVCSNKIVRCPYCSLEPARSKRIYFN